MDESGLLMAPLLRRSWAPRGHPPVLSQKAGHREKVSVAGALCLSPARDHLELFFETIVDGYFSNDDVAGFLEDLVGHLNEPVTVLWDGGSMHQGNPIRQLAARYGAGLRLERLPPHAPELMPLEQAWSWLKYSRLCNYAPTNAAELNERVLRELLSLRTDQRLLRSFFHRSDLPLPRALLS